VVKTAPPGQAGVKSVGPGTVRLGRWLSLSPQRDLPASSPAGHGGRTPWLRRSGGRRMCMV